MGWSLEPCDGAQRNNGSEDESGSEPAAGLVVACKQQVKTGDHRKGSGGSDTNAGNW
jgi:hypothetical protein